MSENLYRILQEAVTNVARHAAARSVTVELEVGEDRARLVVRDTGVGFDPTATAPGRLGLLGMRERAELLGGTFELRSSKGAGTEIVAEIPLPAAGRAG